MKVSARGTARSSSGVAHQDGAAGWSGREQEVDLPGSAFPAGSALIADVARELPATGVAELDAGIVGLA